MQINHHVINSINAQTALLLQNSALMDLCGIQSKVNVTGLIIPTVVLDQSQSDQLVVQPVFQIVDVCKAKNLVTKIIQQHAMASYTALEERNTKRCVQVYSDLLM